MRTLLLIVLVMFLGCGSEQDAATSAVTVAPTPTPTPTPHVVQFLLINPSNASVSCTVAVNLNTQTFDTTGDMTKSALVQSSGFLMYQMYCSKAISDNAKTITLQIKIDGQVVAESSATSDSMPSITYTP